MRPSPQNPFIFLGNKLRHRKEKIKARYRKQGLVIFCCSLRLNDVFINLCIPTVIGP